MSKSGKSPDGRWIAMLAIPLTDIVEVKSATTGEVRHRLTTPGVEARQIAWSFDGRRIAMRFGTSTVEIWDAETGTKTIVLENRNSPVDSFGFSHDGRWIATGGRDGCVRVWETNTGAEYRTLHGFDGSDVWVTNVAWTPDGQWVAATCEGKVKVWQLEDASEVTTIEDQFHSVVGIEGLSFSTDGRRLGTADAEGRIKIRDTTRWEELFAFPADAMNLLRAEWQEALNYKSSERDRTSIWNPARLDDPRRPSGGNSIEFNRRLPDSHPRRTVDGQPVSLDHSVGALELAYRVERASFQLFPAIAECQAAKTPYAKAFWKSRLAVNQPHEAKYWQELQKECIDSATWRLMVQACDLVLQRGPNPHAARCREWAVKQLAVEIAPPPRPAE